MTVPSPSALDSAARDFAGYLAVERGSSANTVEAYERDLGIYVTFLEERGVREVESVTREDVSAFVAFLRETGAAPKTVRRRVSAVRSFHAFLVRDGVTEHHPTADLPVPKAPERLPDVASIEEVDRLLSQPFPEGPRGMRDRAMLEVLYGCGLRVGELVGLDLDDLDLGHGMFRVVGKGDKERVVPVAGAAERALREYLERARPHLRPKGSRATLDLSAVFVSYRGRRLSRQTVHALVRRYGERVGLDLHPHTLRHSYATHMLEGGADLRSLQELLGHADISTTQVYTHVDRRHIREEYMSTHPRARRG